MENNTPTQVPTSPEPQEEQLSFLKKHLYLIIFIIIAVLATGGLLFAFSAHTPQQKDVASVPDQEVSEEGEWETYRNEEYGFGIQYPDILKVVSVSGLNSQDGYLTTFISKDDNYVPGKELPKHSVSIRKIAEPFPAEKLIDILIENTTYDGSGRHPESFNDFEKRNIGDYTFYFIEEGRFEGHLILKYYLSGENGVFSFEMQSIGVDWTNNNLNVEQDQGHLYLKEMLETIKFFDSYKTTGSVYSAVTIRDDNCFFPDDDAGCGQQIVKVDESGESQIVIKNVYDIFGDSSRGSIRMLNFSDNLKEILFIQSPASSAGPKVYLYDLNTNQYQLIASVDYVSGSRLSPDGTKILKMKDGQELHIVDLWTGTESILVSLGDSETFVETIGGYGGDYLGNYSWSNDSDSVCYNVYNPSDNLSVDEKRVSIDYRCVDVN